MKNLIVFSFALCLCATAFAKARNWQEAIVLPPSATNAGAFVVPVGTMFVGGYVQVVHYAFQTSDRIYVTSCYARGLRYRCPDLTVNGKVKVAIDGKYLHVLDDKGKDRKIPIIEKVAPSTHNPKE